MIVDASLVSTAFTFTGDGRMLIAGKAGTVRVHDGATLLPAPALDISSRVCSTSERGLLGIAVDPQFDTTQFIYLYYTYNSPSGCVNRVSRFTLGDDNIAPQASELVLIDNMPTPSLNHNAGHVAFGRDGKLYVATGDGGCDYAGDSGCAGTNDAARDLHSILGKILRIERDGSIPADNPFTGAGTAPCAFSPSITPGQKCQETFSWGLRNPYRFAFDVNAGGTRIYINDVGEGQREEIDEAVAGGDYGWNCKEGSLTINTGGKCAPTPPNMIDPIFEYARNVPVPGTTVSGCSAITGGAFVPNGHWPGYTSTYLFGDWRCSAMFQLSAANTGADFAQSIGDVVHMAFAPLGVKSSLYYMDLFGAVRGVSPESEPGNDPPGAASITSVSAQYGSFPRSVTFTAASTDPDGDTLTYFWDFGDGPAVTTTNTTIAHTFATAGTYKVTVHARDPFYTFSAPATVLIRPGTSAKGDFNRDRRADTVWQNGVTRANTLWRMNGLTAASTASIPAAGSADWKIAAAADMDSDGDADLVWQHATTFQNYVWFMNDNAITSTANLNNHGTNWKIAAVDDFDLDGDPDILYQHASTGALHLWHMSGLSPVDGVDLDNPGASWEVGGAGDFDNDSYPDLVLRNTSNGENKLWFLRDDELLLERMIDDVANTNWRIVAVGDFSGEGRPDLFWYNVATHQAYLWFMTARTQTSEGNVSNPGVDWTPTGPN